MSKVCLPISALPRQRATARPIAQTTCLVPASNAASCSTVAANVAAPLQSVGIVNRCSSLPPSALSIRLPMCVVGRSVFLCSVVCLSTSFTNASETRVLSSCVQCYINTFATWLATCNKALLSSFCHSFNVPDDSNQRSASFCVFDLPSSFCQFMPLHTRRRSTKIGSFTYVVVSFILAFLSCAATLPLPRYLLCPHTDLSTLYFSNTLQPQFVHCPHQMVDLLSSSRLPCEPSRCSMTRLIQLPLACFFFS